MGILGILRPIFLWLDFTTNNLHAKESADTLKTIINPAFFSKTVSIARIVILSILQCKFLGTGLSLYTLGLE